MGTRFGGARLGCLLGYALGSLLGASERSQLRVRPPCVPGRVKTAA